MHQVILKHKKSLSAGSGKSRLCLRILSPVPTTYCSSCSDLQSLFILRTAQSSAPHASLGYLQMVSSLVPLFYGVSTPCVEIGTHWVIAGSALWHGQQLAGLFREYFQSLCQWGRSRRRNREGEVEWWRHPYAPCSCRRSQFSVVLNLGEFFSG